MRVAVGIAAAALVLSGCDWMEKAGAEPLAEARKSGLDQIKRACASKLTYARLKEYVFDEAARIGVSDPRRLDPLAAYSVVRMDNPVVKSRDEELNITVCTGRFVLNLPPGIQDAFDGKPVIAADVEYAAQAALDGSGLVYSMNGAEPIIYRIATLGLRARPMSRLAAAASDSAGEAKAALAESSQEAAPAPAPPAPEPKQRTVIAAKATKAPAAQSARTAKASASPSFNCRHAKTRSEKLVCGSGSLAAADRQMSAVYYSEMAGADAAAKRALRRTRDQFLAKRERCSSESCVERVYQERVAEIRRISGQ